MLTRAVQPWRTLRVPPLLAVSCSSNKHQQGNDRGAQGNRHPKRGETAPAYEIGTPLHVIAGNAELLRMDLQAQNLDTDIVEAIVRQTDRITGLVHQLLTFARAKNEVMGPFALHDPLSHALRLLETRLSREGIRTTLEVPDHLPLLWGAADQIEQVFLNVLVNAWHAMPEGGTVTITAHERDDTRVQVAFRDTGAGMSVAAMEQAFEPFFSTKGEKGTGLGLAICKQIIDNHQGTMRVESTLGAGTTVIMDFIRADTTKSSRSLSTTRARES